MRWVYILAKGDVGGDAGAFRHGIIVDIYAELLYEISEARSVFGCHKLTLFKDKHLFVNFLY